MVLLLMVMPRSRSMSIESRIWSRNSRSSTPPVRWIRRSASVDFPWSIWAMMQKLRMSSKADLPVGGSTECRAKILQRLGCGSDSESRSELQHHLDHVVLVAIGVRPVARDGVALEAEVLQGADCVGLGI